MASAACRAAGSTAAATAGASRRPNGLRRGGGPIGLGANSSITCLTNAGGYGISAVTATTIGAVPSGPFTSSTVATGSDRLGWILR